ncbi:MAG: YCF48-related protein [Candidatus Dormibacteraeota bacterium]|nr:YCF48-related protein [Candidatus Dormibacteraeota bacterium]
MDDRDLREEFREEFERDRPPPDAYDSAVDRAFQRGSGRMPGWASPVAVILAVTMATTLALGAHARVAGQQPVAAQKLARVQSDAKQGPARVSVPAETPDVHVAARTAREALVSSGDVIERTQDGGESWSVVFAGMNGHQGTVRDLEWVTGTVAFAATSYGLLRLDTRPPGFSLVNQRDDVRRIDFVTPLVGYAIADDRVIRTADGGRTFADINVGLTIVSWIQWVSAGHAWAAGPRGVVATSDGGRTWAQQLVFNDSPDSGSSVPWTQVGFTDELNGFAYHRAGDVNTLLHTSDGGGNWEPAPRLPAGVTSDLVVTGPQSAELVQPSAPGRPSLCATADSGMTWRCSDLPLPGDPGQMVAKGAARWLALMDSGAVFAVSQNGETWSTRRRPFQAPAASPAQSPQR